VNSVMIGRGNAGGGPAARWRKAGPGVTAPGRGGGAASGAGDGARDVTGQLITDAGDDPVPPGGPGQARAAADLTWVLAGARNDGVPVFGGCAVPGER
jgi:hypothetical protein